MSSVVKFLLVLAATLALAIPATSHAALSEYQQKIHDEVKAGLDAVKQSLTVARTKLDAGDTTGASNVYNAAVRNYNNHIRRLGQLPASDASVAKLREEKACTCVGSVLKLRLEKWGTRTITRPPARVTRCSSSITRMTSCRCSITCSHSTRSNSPSANG